MAFELEDLGIKELANKCQIKEKHWSNPIHSDPEFLRNADVSLDRIEKLAQEILDEINR